MVEHPGCVCGCLRGFSVRDDDEDITVTGNEGVELRTEWEWPGYGGGGVRLTSLLGLPGCEFGGVGNNEGTT